ncbi:MAG: GGDEF domain-containing protein [Syntrophaceae bacterium]|nr:GGDEF domain-containing protein [Syntrophaceae bacterium]
MAAAEQKLFYEDFLKEVSKFSIIPKDDQKQALRIRRFFMATIAYIFNSSLAYVSYLAGVTEWEAIFWLLIIIPVISITFYIIFRTGINLRMADPSLTLIQMCTAALIVMYVMFFANESRSVLLLMYIIILLFGILRLDTRQFLFISVFILLTYGVNIALLHLFRPQGVNFQNEYLQWFMLALVLVAFSIIGGYISSLRRNLSASRSELQKSNSLIHEMAIRDELTGLYNRRHLMELLKNEKNRSSRNGSQFVVAMLDVDQLKDVNDTYGHPTGDQVLWTVSAIIRDTMRIIDNCGRYGGDEFMLIFAQTDIKGAMISAERIRASIGQSQVPGLGRDFKITVSIGLTEYRFPEEVETMIARVDRALYRAKSGGRNRLECDEFREDIKK